MYKNKIFALFFIFITLLSPSLFSNEQLVKEIFELAEQQKFEEMTEKFISLQTHVSQAQNPIQEGRNILQFFLNEIEAKYSFKLTVQQICEIAKNNLHLCNVPPELVEPLKQNLTLIGMAQEEN